MLIFIYNRNKPNALA